MFFSWCSALPSLIFIALLEGRLAFFQQLLTITSFSRRNTPLQSCEVYCPDPSLPRAESLFARNASTDAELPPLIYHIVSEKPWYSLIACISFETGLPDIYVRELIDFGAIYVGKSECINYGSEDSLKIKSTQKSSAPRMKRAALNMATEPVAAGTYCRVHANPRRCLNAVSNIDWRDRFIRGAEYTRGPHSVLNSSPPAPTPVLFVDKIPGVPVSPTVDNAVENMLHQIELSLRPQSQSQSQRPSSLYLCSRLDTCTSGVVPVATDARTAAVFNDAIAQRGLIEKTYRALCRGPLPVGILRHCFRRKSKSHPNAKPTLLRAYNETLLGVNADDDHGTDPDQTIKRKNNTGNDGRENSKGSSRNRNRNRSGNPRGSVWQLAELEVLSCREVPSRELSEDVFHIHSQRRNSSISETSSTVRATTAAVDCVAPRKRLKDRVISQSGKNLGESDKGSLQQSALDYHDKGGTIKSTNDPDGDSDSDSDCGKYFECKIRLITGRTHQIRLQFAAIGRPIVGDTRYEPVAGLLDDLDDDLNNIDSTNSNSNSNSNSNRNSNSDSSNYNNIDADDSERRSLLSSHTKVGDGSQLFGREPKRIALQCESLFLPMSLARDLGIDIDMLGSGANQDPSFYRSHKPSTSSKSNITTTVQLQSDKILPSGGMFIEERSYHDSNDISVSEGSTGDKQCPYLYQDQHSDVRNSVDRDGDTDTERTPIGIGIGIGITRGVVVRAGHPWWRRPLLL
jgi:RNA pseudouridylate synthase